VASVMGRYPTRSALVSGAPPGPDGATGAPVPGVPAGTPAGPASGPQPAATAARPGPAAAVVVTPRARNRARRVPASR
jgi:hypothetical protein